MSARIGPVCRGHYENVAMRTAYRRPLLSVPFWIILSVWLWQAWPLAMVFLCLTYSVSNRVAYNRYMRDKYPE